MFILAGAILGAVRTFKEKKNRELPFFILISLLFYAFIRVTQLVAAGDIMRYEIFLIPFLCLLSLYGINSKKIYFLIPFILLLVATPCVDSFGIIIIIPFLILTLFIFKKWIVPIILIGTLISSIILLSDFAENPYINLSKEVINITEQFPNSTILYNMISMGYLLNLDDMWDKNYHYYWAIREPQLHNISQGDILVHLENLNEYDPIYVMENESLYTKIAIVKGKAGKVRVLQRN